MKYFSLQESVDNKEIGSYPQVNEYKYIRKFDWTYVKIGALLGKANMDHHPFTPILDAKSKPTDYISHNHSLFLILSHRLLDTIKGYDLGKFQTWDLKVQHGGNILDNYHLFHSVHPVHDGVIDYKKSEFEIGKIGDWKKLYRKPVSFQSSHDFKTTHEELRAMNESETIVTERLVLDFRNIELDLFRIYYPPYGDFYVSEKLKKAIENEGLTGVRFVPLEEDNKIEAIY